MPRPWVTGASLVLPWHLRLQRALAQATPSLDPTTIPKFQTPLVIPPAMPLTARIRRRTIDYYAIAVVQFLQQILPTGLPGTRVWSYQLRNARGTRNYPAFTIEALADRPVRVNWINGLVDGAGNYLPHILPVDPTLHWANPPGGVAGRDSRPTFATTPGPYTGPVPIVTHLHGGHSNEEHDGYAEAWYLPDAANIPAGYATVGSFYEEFKAKSQAATGAVWAPGTAVFQYDNDQPASTLWFHDHTLGMTRANVYAGPAGFYLLRGGANDLPPGVLPGPAPARGDPPGTRYFEIPLAIQDRSFNADGSLFYPDSRAFFDGFTGPYVPDSDVSPIWNPEVFGNAMLGNGKTWPFLEVEPRRYRLRVLNGCNGRFLILRLDPELSFWQIGAEGGFLPAPVRLGELLMGPADRARRALRWRRARRRLPARRPRHHRAGAGVPGDAAAERTRHQHPAWGPDPAGAAQAGPDHQHPPGVAQRGGLHLPRVRRAGRRAAGHHEPRRHAQPAGMGGSHQRARGGGRGRGMGDA